MPVKKLDHVNIRTPRLPETIAFYRDVLGMEVGASPAVTDMRMGTWVHDESGAAAIHLVSSEMAVPTRDAGDPPPEWGSGSIDHVAFECTGYDEMAARFEASGRGYRTNAIASINLRQIFVEDPNGVLVELNFR